MKTHPRVNLEALTDYHICQVERFIFNNLFKELMVYVSANYSEISNDVEVFWWSRTEKRLYVLVNISWTIRRGTHIHSDDPRPRSRHVYS
jgi:hypothetical protein